MFYGVAGGRGLLLLIIIDSADVCTTGFRGGLQGVGYRNLHLRRTDVGLRAQGLDFSELHEALEVEDLGVEDLHEGLGGLVSRT